jgi:tRNA (cytidine/uridine-2'-O-)-methyltransferase
MTLPTPKSSPTPSTIPASSDGQPSPNANIAVVLVEPRIPQNAGNIARLCVCAGAELFLVGSLGFRLGSEKHLKRAGMDYLASIELKHVPDFEAVLSEKPGWTPYFLSTKAKRLYTEIAYTPDTLLVFGSETQGLPASWLEKHPEQSLRIPMREGARSLNLANSVAIVLYEAIRQMGMPPC